MATKQLHGQEFSHIKSHLLSHMEKWYFYFSSEDTETLVS